jgi:predicted small metal-binding protein
MRVVECNICGELVSGADDAELVDAVRRHMDEHHGDAGVDDARVRDLVEQGAYEATDA